MSSACVAEVHTAGQPTIRCLLCLQASRTIAHAMMLAAVSGAFLGFAIWSAAPNIIAGGLSNAWGSLMQDSNHPPKPCSALKFPKKAWLTRADPEQVNCLTLHAFKPGGRGAVVVCCSPGKQL